MPRFLTYKIVVSIYSKSTAGIVQLKKRERGYMNPQPSQVIEKEVNMKIVCVPNGV